MGALPEAGVLNGWIDPAVVARVPEYAAAFNTANPFPHVVIDGFLDAGFCRRIVQEFPVFDEAAALNEDGKVGGKATRESVRSLGSAYAELDDLVQTQAFRDLVARITGIADLQYDPHYFGGGTHENRQGQDLDPHIDFNYHPLSKQHRRLNLIIYLNEEWDDTWGGSLQLHRDPYLEPSQDEIVTVTPLMNRCVMFETSEHSWHGFERIDLPEGRQGLSRKSFALYYYTRERPPEETGPEHSTVYVERHLPERFRAGMTLSEQDVQEIKTLLARRDQHLQRLYRQVSARGVPPHASHRHTLYARVAQGLYALENRTGIKITVPLKALRNALRGRR